VRPSVPYEEIQLELPVGRHPRARLANPALH
jgi:hypothetical protein